MMGALIESPSDEPMRCCADTSFLVFCEECGTDKFPASRSPQIPVRKWPITSSR